MRHWTGLKRSIIIIVTVISLTPLVGGAETAPNDVLLNTLPSDCMFCLRINNLNETLGKLDTYLAGASPVPVSTAMLINMQIGAIIGDPMLTGIDMGGDFVIFGLLPQADQTEPSFGILVPVNNFKQFTTSNPNCKQDEDGIVILSSPNPSSGSFALAEAGNGKYALAVWEPEKEKLGALQKALVGESSLSKRLSPVQSKEMTTVPVWAFVNVTGLYEKYRQDVTGMIQMAEQGMGATGAPAEMMAFQFKMLTEMFTLLEDADSLTMALMPEAALLSIDTSLRAKSGTDLAEMFVGGTSSGGYRLTGYLDDKNAVNGLMKINGPFLQKFYDKMYDIMEAISDQPDAKEQTAKMKALTQKMFAAMGDEVAFSFSYAGSIPPFKLQEVVAVKDAAAMKSMMGEGLDYANSMYKAMGIPAQLKYQQGTSTYKNAAIDTVSIEMSVSDDPNNPMQKELEKIYGQDFKYYLAQTPDKMYVTMGPDSEQLLKTLIDQPTSAAPATGDMKIAMDALQGTPYDEFMCSINLIKLFKGMGEMIQTLGVQGEMGPAAGIFTELANVQSQSCLVAGGAVSDGSASIRLAIPKQHLIEVVTTAMQIQQKTMEQQSQDASTGIMPQLQGEPNTQSMAPGLETSKKNPLEEWIGKGAPELRVVDLQGNIHRVSRLKGKKVMLDFWATWCPPCKESIPDLVKMRSDSKESELVILGLSDEPADKLNPFIKDLKVNYPIVSYNETLPAPYGQVTAIPTLFLIDTEGVIRDVLVGYHDLEDIQSHLSKIN